MGDTPPEQSIEVNISQRTIDDALQGSNVDQKTIATEGLRIVAMVLDKNSDYVGSAYKTPALAGHLTAWDAMLCRASDKVARIDNLQRGQAGKVDEAIEDTIRDLAGYCILLLGSMANNGGPE